MEIGEISLLLGFINLMVISISVIVLYTQIKKAHEWNRRKMSQEMLYVLTGDLITKARQIIENDLGAKIFSGKENYDIFIKKLQQDKKKLLQENLKLILNFFEIMELGIKNNVVDEDICFDYGNTVCISYFEWAQPFIERERENLSVKYPLLLIKYEGMVKRWKERINKINELVPGKKPT